MDPSTTLRRSTTRRSRSRLPAQAGPGQVDQRPGRAERRLPAASAAGRPDAALGQPARRAAGPGRARRRPGALPGPVPIVTHLHGGHVTEESTATRRRGTCRRRAEHPRRLRREGSFYQTFRAQAQHALGQAGRRAAPSSSTTTTSAPRPCGTTTTRWDDARSTSTRGRRASTCCAAGPTTPSGILPGPAPALGDPPGRDYFEIPIAIQDRSFNADGALFYPDNRAFFEASSRPSCRSRSCPIRLRRAERHLADLEPGVLRQHDRRQRQGPGRRSTVERRRYRFRFLNGCNSRFLILRHVATGCRSGRSAPRVASCPRPIEVDRAAARPGRARRRHRRLHERPGRDEVILENIGPDEPFGGGIARTSTSSPRTPRRRGR